MMKQTVNQTADGFNRAASNMASAFKAVIADSEDLLKAAATVSGDGFAVARAKFEEKLRNARASLADVSGIAVEKTKEAAAAADDYAHASPWAAIGIAAAAGMLIGFLAAKR